jgi:hypothetical protein
MIYFVVDGEGMDKKQPQVISHLLKVIRLCEESPTCQSRIFGWIATSSRTQTRDDGKEKREKRKSSENLKV